MSETDDLKVKGMLMDLRRGRDVLFILVPAGDPDYALKVRQLNRLIDGLTGESATFVVRINPHRCDE